MQRTATQDEVILVERGMAAENLLKDQTFGMVINALTNQFVMDLVNTAPAETKERDAAYYSTKALQGIIATLNSWVAVKEQVAKGLEEDQENTEDPTNF